MGGMNRGLHAHRRRLEIVERRVLVAGGVLDRAADQADGRRLADRLGRRIRRIAEALLEIADHRQVDRFGNGAGIGQRLLTGHLAVALAEHARLGAARGRQRREAETGQQARGAGIPWIGDHERTRRLVQRAQLLHLVGLADAHDVSLQIGRQFVHGGHGDAIKFASCCRERTLPSPRPGQ